MRNEYLFKRACRLRAAGWDLAAIENDLREINAEFARPLSYTIVDRIAERGSRYDCDPTPDTRKRIVDMVTRRPGLARAEIARLLHRPQAALAGTDRAALTWLVLHRQLRETGSGRRNDPYRYHPGDAQAEDWPLTKLMAAALWTEGFLAEGGKRTANVLRAAKQAGISARTLYRARKRYNTTSTWHTGWGKPSVWFLSLRYQALLAFPAHGWQNYIEIANQRGGQLSTLRLSLALQSPHLTLLPPHLAAPSPPTPLRLCARCRDIPFVAVVARRGRPGCQWCGAPDCDDFCRVTPFCPHIHWTQPDDTALDISRARIAA